jgi:hypothetical protein
MLIEELLNRTRLEKLLRDSYGNYCVQVRQSSLLRYQRYQFFPQTALDYAEPTQRILLVEGIRPVLPLIRNTPYGKRIQNKLQREHMDHFGSFHNQQAIANIALGNPGVGLGHHGSGRHMPPNIHQGNHMADVYGSQAPLYSLQGPASMQGQGSFNQSHMNAQMHALQPQSMDGYVLQGNSGHSQSLVPAITHGGGFPGASTFANVSHFGNVGLDGSLNGQYQRSPYGYGM